jgi:hypothetical protein
MNTQLPTMLAANNASDAGITSKTRCRPSQSTGESNQLKNPATLPSAPFFAQHYSAALRRPSIIPT